MGLNQFRAVIRAVSDWVAGTPGIDSLEFRIDWPPNLEVRIGGERGGRRWGCLRIVMPRDAAFGAEYAAHVVAEIEHESRRYREGPIDPAPLPEYLGTEGRP